MVDRKSNGDNTTLESDSCKSVDKCPQIRAIKEDLLVSPWFNYMEMEKNEIVKRARDSVRMFKQKDIEISESMLLQYPNSPTAIKFWRAMSNFTLASQILGDYTKDKVESMEDCETLSPAFQSIVHGYINENSIFDSFRRPENTSLLIDQYLRLRPKDICAEYAKIIIYLRAPLNPEKRENNLLSDFECAKLRIKTSEMFALKLRRNLGTNQFKRNVLADIYYLLGAIYVSTDQYERARNIYEKCYDLDNTHFSALYGIAYTYLNSNQEKAKGLFQKYLTMAPKCDKQYPNAYYMIASVYQTQNNFEEAFRYCSMAEDAEKLRLPFLPPVSIPMKSIMLNFKRMFEQTKLLENKTSV
ncbi:Hypothetical predicted protein [Mytilus galloprovincialis]|nr:Hypothetical predicted protein [Mytilus galloprovincialis]